MERIEKYNEAEAMVTLGCDYNTGRGGLSVDQSKAVELFRRSSELGCAEAHYSLGNAYMQGEGLEMDKKKAKHHWKISAMMGSIDARYNLGCYERDDGNIDRAMKHFMIAAKYGDDASLQIITICHTAGHMSKEDFAKTLREHQASQDETRSEQRDKAKLIRVTQNL